MKVDVRINGLGELLSGARLARLEDRALRRLGTRAALAERIRTRRIERRTELADEADSGGATGAPRSNDRH